MGTWWPAALRSRVMQFRFVQLNLSFAMLSDIPPSVDSITLHDGRLYRDWAASTSGPREADYTSGIEHFLGYSIG